MVKKKKKYKKKNIKDGIEGAHCWKTLLFFREKSFPQKVFLRMNEINLVEIDEKPGGPKKRFYLFT